MLLRPDAAAYQVGDTMNLEVLTNVPSGQVYLDIVREGQTVSTRSLKVDDGRVLEAVDLTPDLFGTLELHAYKILSSGTITRDTRLVVVDAPSDLTLVVVADQETYLPGDMAGLDFEVTGQDGEGAQSALGIAIVDESVFALAQEDPGFAKLYFLLEAELLRPKYDIHGFSVPDLLGEIPDDPELLTAMEGAAQASMADVGTMASPFSLNLNSHDEKINRAYELQAAFFAFLGSAMVALEVFLGLGVSALMVASVVRSKAFGGGFTIFLAVALVLTLGFFAIPIPDWAGTSPIDRLGYVLEEVFYGGGAAPFVLCLAGLGLFGGMALIAYVFVRKDWFAGGAILLTVGFLPASFGLFFAAARMSEPPSEAVIVIWALSMLLVPLAYLLRAAGFGAKLEIGWAFAALFAAPVALLMVVTPLIVGATMGASFSGVISGGELGAMRQMAAPEMMVEAPMDMAMEVEEAMPAATPMPARTHRNRSNGIPLEGSSVIITICTIAQNAIPAT